MKATASRPSHFVAIRLRSDKLKAQAKTLQQVLVRDQPPLEKACTPAGWQHLTLFVLTLDNDEEVRAAEDIMQSASDDVRGLLSGVRTEGALPQLQVTGLQRLKKQSVLAFDVERDATVGAIRDVIRLLYARFAAAGFTQPELAAQAGGGLEAMQAEAAKVADKWTPHSTIMKLSKLRGSIPRCIHTQVLQERGFMTQPFDTVSFSCIELNAMQGYEDGYYPVLARAEL